MVMVNNHGQIKQYIKVNIKMEKSMAKECFYGLMIVLIKDNFLKIIFMVQENILGKMEEYIQDNGKIIKCKEKEFLHGQMEEDMKVGI